MGGDRQIISPDVPLLQYLSITGWLKYTMEKLDVGYYDPEETRPKPMDGKKNYLNFS